MSTYVYAIVHAAHPLGTEPRTGVGEPPSPVRMVTEGDLGAIVSDAPEGLRAKRRDLLAHQQVLAELSAAGPVLPMRFGSLSPDDAAVKAVLAERGEHFLERLRELEGRVEFNVKAAHREDQVLRLILGRDQQIRELNERSRQSGSYDDRLRLGEMVANAVKEQETQDAELVRQSLRPLAAAESVGPDTGDTLCNFSFLVDRSVSGDFEAAFARLESEQPHLELSLHGPLPPYSFVEPAQQNQNA